MLPLAWESQLLSWLSQAQKNQYTGFFVPFRPNQDTSNGF
jgi:hypothetical protein